jgi:predicted Fe-Mo cluster-binding NifX family protein
MEARKQMAKDLRNHKAKLDEQIKSRIKKLDEFVLKQVSEEIEEFSTDRKLLAETRAKLVFESKQKLNETKAAFIKRAAALVEATVNQTLTKELAQLKEELRVVRENNFGRKIFEAFGAEFMNSYLAEGTKVKAVIRQVGELKAKLAEAEKKAAEAISLYECANRKVRSAEEQAQRARIMSELLQPLTKEKRSVMEQMLQGVKTEKLREHYSRYLPAVVGDSAPKRAALNEDSARQVVTGDRNNKLAESAKEDDKKIREQLGEIIQLRKLAGIQ